MRQNKSDSNVNSLPTSIKIVHNSDERFRMTTHQIFESGGQNSNMMAECVSELQYPNVIRYMEQNKDYI